jgi:hypothetical protein
LRIGRLRDEGWKTDDSGNYSTVVNENGTLAIAVATGDDNTGIYTPDKPFASPGLKYPKGDMTRRAVERNSLNTYLFPDMAEDARAQQAKLDAADNRITWILLRRRDKDTVYSELSLPWELSDAGHVLSWKRRIILEPLDVDPILEILADSGNDPGDVIEVPVQRR